MSGDSAPICCPGPLIWYEVDIRHTVLGHRAAILHCATCGYIVISGNYNDREHADTELMREGLAQ